MTKRSTGESSRGSHRASCMANCPRCYGYQYLLGIEPKAIKKGLARGSCNHIGTDAYYHGEDHVSAIMGADQKIAYMAVESIAIVDAYIRRYPVDFSGSRPRDIMGEVIFVEEEFEFSVCGDEPMTRRLDLGIATKKGLLFILDHKTAARISERLKKTSLDMTLFTQAMVGKRVIAPRYGLRWGGVVLNMLPTVPKEDKFVRQHLTYTQEFLNEAERSLHYWLRQERMTRSAFDNGQLDPWALAQSFNCYPQGYACDFWHLCTKGKSAMSRYEAKR